MHGPLRLPLLAFALLACKPGFPPPPPDQPPQQDGSTAGGGREPAPPVEVSSSKFDRLDSATILASLAKRATKGSDLALLLTESKRLGYTPSTNPKDLLGYRYTAIPTKELLPPRGEQGAPVKEFTSEFLVQTLTKSGSKTQAAVVALTVRAGDNVKTRDLILAAPSGTLDLVAENIVFNGAIWHRALWDDHGGEMLPPPGYVGPFWSQYMGLEYPVGGNYGDDGDDGGGGGPSPPDTPSWWWSFKGCLQANAAETCLAAVGNCAWTAATFVGYFGCVATGCASAVVGCVFCQDCECRWWCEWTCYCCHPS